MTKSEIKALSNICLVMLYGLIAFLGALALLLTGFELQGLIATTASMWITIDAIDDYYWLVSLYDRYGI